MQEQIFNKNNKNKNLTHFEQRVVDFFSEIFIDFLLKKERESKGVNYYVWRKERKN